MKSVRYVLASPNFWYHILNWAGEEYEYGTIEEAREGRDNFLNNDPDGEGYTDKDIIILCETVEEVT